MFIEIDEIVLYENGCWDWWE